jgi:hypothetical protein
VHACEDLHPANCERLFLQDAIVLRATPTKSFSGGMGSKKKELP